MTKLYIDSREVQKATLGYDWLQQATEGTTRYDRLRQQVKVGYIHQVTEGYDRLQQVMMGLLQWVTAGHNRL